MSIGEYSEFEQMYLCTLAVGKYSNDYWKEYINTKGEVAYLIASDAIGAGKGILKHGPEIIICGMLGGVGCGLVAAGKAALWPAIFESTKAGVLLAVLNN